MKSYGKKCLFKFDAADDTEENNKNDLLHSTIMRPQPVPIHVTFDFQVL